MRVEPPVVRNRWACCVMVVMVAISATARAVIVPVRRMVNSVARLVARDRIGPALVGMLPGFLLGVCDQDDDVIFSKSRDRLVHRGSGVGVKLCCWFVNE